MPYPHPGRRGSATDRWTPREAAELTDVGPQSREGPPRDPPGRATQLLGIETRELLSTGSAGGLLYLLSHGLQLDFDFLWNEHVVGDVGDFLCLAPGRLQQV